jgi:S-adenosylmethionine-dependent methyltransferase
MAPHTAEGIASPLDGPGCPRADHYGIRSVCDYIADDERKHDPAFYADLERLEPAVTARPVYRHTVRLLQSVARREPAACAPPARAGA